MRAGREAFRMGAVYELVSRSAGESVAYVCVDGPRAWKLWRSLVKDGSHDDETMTTTFPNGSLVRFNALRDPVPASGLHEEDDDGHPVMHAARLTA